MYIYIKIDVKNKYVELNEELSSSMYLIGNSYNDYLNKKWVLLSDEQVSFRNENPNASVKEVWEMKLSETPLMTIEKARMRKIEEIEFYNVSEDVDSFIINDTINAWFTVQERLNYKQSIEAAKLLNIEKLSFYVKDVKLEIAPIVGEQMLALIQLYADQCFMVTKQHLLNVNALSTIEEIEAYNYKEGYPEKLKFEL